MSLAAATWALNDAPMPKSDPTARLVLAYLGDKADKDGRNAYPLALSIAHALDLNPEVVSRVLKRLCGYGLISKDGLGPQGQPRWVLHMHQQRAKDSFEEFCDAHRGKRSARQSRWRNKAGVDDPSSSTVDDSKSSSVDDRESSHANVDDSSSSRRRSCVVSKTTESRLVDDRESPHNGPYNGPTGNTTVSGNSPDPQGSEHANHNPKSPYPAAFEAAWTAYGRRGTKRDAARQWQRAIKRASAETITAAIPAYVASTPDLRYRKHMERWLRDDGWESAPVPARQATGQHEPYQDRPIADFYEDLI